jgi:DNA-binding NarL/FixJ family response regulator
MPLSVLIADDNEAIRAAMMGYFKTLSGWIIGGEAKNGTEAIQKAVQLKPDLVILDFSMPSLNAVEAASVIKGLLPDVHIVVFTLFDDALGSRLSSAVGVDLVIPKAEGLTALIRGVEHLMGADSKIERKAEAAGSLPGGA